MSTESQIQIKERIVSQYNTFRRLMPAFADAEHALTAEAYAGGTLDAKTKRLMALCAAVVADCEGCILFQCNQALQLGASVDEILEVLAVAVSLGGTMAAAHCCRVIALLEEQDLLCTTHDN